MKILHRTFLCLIVILMLLVIQAVKVAAETMDEVPYTSYTYWQGYSSKVAVPTKAVYEPVKVIDGYKLGIGSFTEPQYVFYDGKGTVYIMDSGNGRIILLDSNYNLLKVISELDWKGEKINFKGAKGLYVSPDGTLYIADTNKQRILCCKNYEVFNVLGVPKSNLIPKSFKYAPARIVKDQNNFLYVLSDGSYYGAMVYSPNGEFYGFFGADTVETNAFSAIGSLITSLFETEKKHQGSIQTLPYQFEDLCIDSRGFLYTVNGSALGQIRRFGSNGTNIMVYRNQFSNSSADKFNFADNPNIYWENMSKYTQKVKESFQGITTDKEGYIYTVDSTQGRIFMYDTECNLITIFGGGLGAGAQMGTFVTPTSISAAGQDLLVSDFVNNNVTVFRMTNYGRQVKTANALTLEGKYDEAKSCWNSVLGQDKNCQLAYKGLAKEAILSKDYKTAMNYAKAGLDQVTYAQAFEVVRNTYLKQNFWWIGLLALIAISGIVWVLIITNRREVVLIGNPKLRVSLSVITHPFNSFNSIKYKGMGSLLISTAFLAVFYIVKVTEKLNGGFMYVITNNSSFNAIFILLGTVGVLLLWVLVNWAVCILFEGKGRLKEIYYVSCYCLMPQIIYSILFLILSHLVIPSHSSLFSILSTICNISTAVLILISMTVVHEFDFFKSIGTAVATIIGMGVAAFVIFIVLMLGQDFVGFIIGIFREVLLR